MLSKHHKCNVCWHVVIYWGQKNVIYRLFELIFNDLFAIFLYDQLFSHLSFLEEASPGKMPLLQKFYQIFRDCALASLKLQATCGVRNHSQADKYQPPLFPQQKPFHKSEACWR